uniref:Liver-expressed antimicrobial peptide 2 n=1 Tax=Panagrellus redivivus TaxID=6233 RepID=A0A7E4USF2_PANRE
MRPVYLIVLFLLGNLLQLYANPEVNVKELVTSPVVQSVLPFHARGEKTSMMAKRPKQCPKWCRIRRCPKKCRKYVCNTYFCMYV